MEIFISIMFFLVKMLDYISTPIYNYKSRNKRQFLPSLNSDMLRISATDLADKIRKKEISSEEICQIYIARIKEVNPIINAVVQDRFREALKEAKKVDDYLKTTSLDVGELETIKPLLGVPITIKEACSVQGLNICVGLQSRLGYKAENDSEVVARIKSCGAIVLLVSTTPELCLSWETSNYVTGVTRNPYDSTCATAGSSGGEGALLGSGASLIGVGSDIAGSIRLPSLFNGIFGHKPTPKIIPIKGHYPIGQDEKYLDFLVIGPMARYATDLRLLMHVMMGNKLSTELRINEPVDLSQLNIFFMEDLGFSITLPSVSEDIKCAIRDSVKYLGKNCGATIDEYKFEDFANATVICGSALFSLKDTPNPMKWENVNIFTEFMRCIFGKSKFTLNLMYYYFIQGVFQNIVGDYSRENSRLKALVLNKLGKNGVILLPTSIGPAHKHNQFYFKNGFAYLIIANSLGLPSTHIPCGFDKQGMPIGIQVLAAPHQDRLCLAVAEELERCFGGWIPPPEKG